MFVGRPIRVLKRTFVLRAVFCLGLLPLAALSGLAAYAAATEKTPDLLTSAICVAIIVGLLGALVWLFRREAGLELRLYEDGLAAVAGRAIRELRWDEVELVWFRAIRVQAGGLLGAAIGAAVDAAVGSKGKMGEASTSLTVRLVGGGRRIALTSNYKGVVAAVEQVLQRVNPRLVADCIRRVEDGQAVRFGKVFLSAAGVRVGKRAPVAFGDLQQFAIVRGRLKVKKRGAWRTEGVIPIKEIPNVTVLVEAYDRVRGRSAAAGPVLGRHLAASESI
jgi:hypothetical protein